MLTPADMERVLENLDRRLTAIEQKLPTLATSAQVESLQLATSQQLDELRTWTSEQFAAQRAWTSEQFAAQRAWTSEQLEALRTSTTEQIEALAAAMAQGLEDGKQFARMLNDETKDRIRLVADGLAHLTRRVDDLPTRSEFNALSTRVDDVGVAVGELARSVAVVGQSVTTLTGRLEQRGVI